MCTYHILPINDIKRHNNNGEWCHCSPEIRRDSNGVLVIHHSYDAREFQEELEKEWEHLTEGMIEYEA